MGLRLIIFFLILLIASAFSYNQKLHFGKYKNLRRYWGDEFILNSDFTFIYKCHNRTNDFEFRDSSSGKFTMIGDTILFNYLFDNYYPFMSDSPEDSVRWQIVDPHGYFGNRPQILYWEGKRLYYINETTGEVFRNKENHLQHIK